MTDEKFRQAAERMKRLKSKPTEDELLELYSLYKQSVIGDCNVQKPGLFDIQGRAKWCAWNNKKGVTRESAKKEYILTADRLIKKYGIVE